jgi:integrase
MKARGSGCILERPKDSGNFWISYYYHGEEQRESARKVLGKLTVTRREAEQLLKTRIGEIAVGRFTGLERERLTVGELLTDYITHLQTTGRKAIATAKSCVRQLYIEFSDVRAVDLKPPQIRTWMNRCLEEGKAPGYVVQLTSRLRSALSLAHKEGRVAAVPYIPTITLNNVRQGFVAPADFEPFVAALPSPYDDVARFAYQTGWRRGEVLGLQWPNVDFRAGEIRLGDTKNGDGRVVPMYWQDEHGQRHMLAFAQVLEKRRRERALTPWVFHRNGKPVDRFEGPWRQAARAVGLPYMGCPDCPRMPQTASLLALHLVEDHGATREAALAQAKQIKKASQILHDFRRSAVKNMIDAGVPEVVAMKISGHRSFTTFQRYNIRNLRDVAAGLRRTEVYVQAQPADTDNSRTNRPIAIAKGAE